MTVEYLDAPIAAVRHVYVVALSMAMLWGVLNCPGPLPGCPHDLIQFPSVSTLAIRELM